MFIVDALLKEKAKVFPIVGTLRHETSSDFDKSESSTARLRDGRDST